MNRATFFQKLTIASGLLFGAPATARVKENNNRTPIRKRKVSHYGYNTRIHETPWGQLVFYDRYTYADYQKSIWRIEGKSKDEIEQLSVKLQYDLNH